MEKSIYTYEKKWPWIFYLLPLILFSGGYLMYKIDHHLFYIQDNGKAIEAAYSQQIFDMFQRLSITQSGSGLGLAICKKIIEQAGGNIWHEAAMEGGNIFYFTLPYSSYDSEP